MAKSSITADMLHLNLKQLGATKINSNSSRVSVIKFEINPELTVSYFCHIKDEEKIYLQRIEPYPVRNYKFETVDNIVAFIKKDVEQFENASKSSNFKLFLNIIDRNYAVRRELEELFLLHNIPHESLDKILDAEDKTLALINSAEYETLKNDPGRCEGEEAHLEDIFEMDQDLSESINAAELYGEKPTHHHGIFADSIKESVKEVIMELKDEIKAEIREELKKDK